MSPEAFAALEGSLVQKLEGLERLVALAEANRQALITHDVDAIIEINQKQTDELSRLDRLQRASAKMLERLASALGVDGPGASLSAVAPLLPDRQRERLEELSGRLTEEASRLATASEINATLSANALEFIRLTLNAVSQAQQEEAGQPVPAAPGSLVLDAQV